MKTLLFYTSIVVLTLGVTWSLLAAIAGDFVSFWFGFPWVLAAAEGLYISLEK